MPGVLRFIINIFGRDELLRARGDRITSLWHPLADIIPFPNPPANVAGQMPHEKERIWAQNAWESTVFAPPPPGMPIHRIINAQMRRNDRQTGNLTPLPGGITIFDPRALESARQTANIAWALDCWRAALGGVPKMKIDPTSRLLMLVHDTGVPGSRWLGRTQTSIPPPMPTVWPPLNLDLLDPLALFPQLADILPEYHDGGGGWSLTEEEITRILVNLNADRDHTIVRWLPSRASLDQYWQSDTRPLDHIRELPDALMSALDITINDIITRIAENGGALGVPPLIDVAKRSIEQVLARALEPFLIGLERVGRPDLHALQPAPGWIGILADLATPQGHLMQSYQILNSYFPLGTYLPNVGQVARAIDEIIIYAGDMVAAFLLACARLNFGERRFRDSIETPLRNSIMPDQLMRARALGLRRAQISALRATSALIGAPDGQTLPIARDAELISRAPGAVVIEIEGHGEPNENLLYREACIFNQKLLDYLLDSNTIYPGIVGVGAAVRTPAAEKSLTDYYERGADMERAGLHVHLFLDLLLERVIVHAPARAVQQPVTVNITQCSAGIGRAALTRNHSRSTIRNLETHLMEGSVLDEAAMAIQRLMDKRAKITISQPPLLALTSPSPVYVILTASLGISMAPLPQDNDRMPERFMGTLPIPSGIIELIFQNGTLENLRNETDFWYTNLYARLIFSYPFDYHHLLFRRQIIDDYLAKVVLLGSACGAGGEPHTPRVYTLRLRATINIGRGPWMPRVAPEPSAYEYTVGPPRALTIVPLEEIVRFMGRHVLNPWEKLLVINCDTFFTTHLTEGNYPGALPVVPPGVSPVPTNGYLRMYGQPDNDILLMSAHIVLFSAILQMLVDEAPRNVPFSGPKRLVFIHKSVQHVVCDNAKQIIDDTNSRLTPAHQLTPTDVEHMKKMVDRIVNSVR